MECYRDVLHDPRRHASSALRLSVTYTSMLFFGVATLTLSQVSREVKDSIGIDVVVDRDRPGIAILARNLADQSGVRDVRFVMGEELSLIPTEDQPLGAAPRFFLRPRKLDPDSIAAVAAAIRRSAEVLNVLYPQALVVKTLDLIARLRVASISLGIMVLFLSVLVVIDNAKQYAEQRARASGVIRRLGGSSLFIASPGAILGGMIGVLASGAALGSLHWAIAILGRGLDPARLSVEEGVAFLAAGLLLTAAVYFVTMLSTSRIKEEEPPWGGNWI